ncbi:MAG: hypothetical protein RIN56_06950 [Sporomusaceae bacterium]|nr:hypothetical protein [Sporomusaceae bacterium]
MSFFKGPIFKVVLPLILALSVISGTVAAADGQAPTPPTATSVALNTYGSLPVVVLNLTQSPINMNMSFTAPNGYATTGWPVPLPIAAGLPGVYYLNGSQTATFANILTPNVTPTNNGNFSLNPIATVDSQNNIAYSKNSGWMSMFTTFPSWTLSGMYKQVQFVKLGNEINNQGAAAYNSEVLTGYPSSDAKNITSNFGAVSASALNAGQAAVATLKLNLLNSNGTVQAAYDININSLGGGTSGSVAIPQSGFSILHALHTAADILADGKMAIEGDPLAIIDLIDGIGETVDGIVTAVSNANSTNVNVTTDKAYPAKSKGINVTATADPAGFPSGATLSAYSGDSQSLMYEVKSAANQQLPLTQQNAVFVTTWRQSPQNNYGVSLPNGADILFVVVLNQGVYASNQVQQYINNNAPTQMAGGAKYQPTKAQAQESAKILGILTAIAKKNPQDAKLIIDLFGVRGKHAQVKNDPAALKNLGVQLKTVLEKHKNELPAIEQYLTKLARK